MDRVADDRQVVVHGGAALSEMIGYPEAMAGLKGQSDHVVLDVTGPDDEDA